MRTRSRSAAAYCDPLARLIRADRLSARARARADATRAHTELRCALSLSLSLSLSLCPSLSLSPEGFNAPRILVDWIKRITDSVRRSCALTVNLAVKANDKPLSFLRPRVTKLLVSATFRQILPRIVLRRSRLQIDVVVGMCAEPWDSAQLGGNGDCLWKTAAAAAAEYVHVYNAHRCTRDRFNLVSPKFV